MMRIIYRSPFHYLVFLIILFLYVTPGYPQNKVFHTDSLDNNEGSSLVKTGSHTLGEFLKGIAASNYTKPTFIEIIPTTAKEVPRIPVPVVDIRPRLITGLQINMAGQNIQREPYLTWYQLIRKSTDRYVYGSSPVLTSPVLRQAENIKNLAFIYRIEGDIRYLRAAERLLEQLPEAPKIFNLEGGKGNVGWGDFLQSAQAIPAICVAVDLLYEDLNPDLQQEVRRKLLQVTAQLMDAVVYTPANNHVTVMSVAILVNALFEDKPRDYIAYSRQEIWITGLEAFSRGLGLVIPDGGYAEGVYYARFILDYIAPLSIYFQNNTGEKLFEHPYLERMINWINANDKGSGQYSAFDDAYQVDFFILPVIINQSRLKNNWYAHWASLPAKNRALRNMAEAICVFETMPNALDSSQPAVSFFPESGQVVFRDSSLRPQIFGSFISERPEWFAARHEHIDPMSFEITAFENDFIIDAGYGEGTGSINREWYLSAQAHNGLFKNGLGTNLNPIWGDPIYSTFKHAFATRRAASMSMEHYLGDVKLNRSVYFLNRRYFLIYDAFTGDGEYSAGLNFNYLGRLHQASPYQLSIEGESSQLDVYTLNSKNGMPLITENFGLYTPPGRPEPMRTVQIEHEASGDEFFLSLIYPSAELPAAETVVQLPVSGKGSGLKIRDNERYTETWLILNRNHRLNTARFSTDARLSVVEFENVNRISALLLVDFTHFDSPLLGLSSEYPITLYMEYNGFFWQGYIQVEDERMDYHLTISGIEEFPFRFNRSYVHPIESKIPTGIFPLTGSGTIDIGNGPAVQIPYRHHATPNFLRWFSEQYDYQEQYEFWSDYHRNVLDNQIVGHLEDGFVGAIDYYTHRYFPETDLIRNGGYVAFGLLQSSYSSGSRTTYTPRIPHRYQYSSSNDQMVLSIYEEGIFSTDFLRIQNFHLDLRRPRGDGISYRGANWFEQQQMHRFRLFNGRGSQVLYQLSRFRENENHHLQVSYAGKRFMLNPGYHWNNMNVENDIFLNWQILRYSGSFRKSEDESGNRYYQSIAGYGRQWAFSVEGQQVRDFLNNYQDYYGDFFLGITHTLFYAQGLRLHYQDTWELAHSYSELNWMTLNRGIGGKMEKQDSNWNQNLAFFWNTNSQRVSGDVTLSDFTFGKRNIARIKWQYYTKNRFRISNQAKYIFRPVQDNYGVELYHSLWIPAKNGWAIQPILGESIPSDYFFQWYGAGISYYSRHSLYGQVLISSLLRPIQVDYQTSVTINGRQAGPLYSLWFQLRQLGESVYSMEIRIQQGNAMVRPGIYYSYLRDGGIRFEGYLQWHW